MNLAIKASLLTQFTAWCGQEATSFEVLPLAGSNRTYVRLRYSAQSAIGVHNPNPPENQAFIKLAAHMRAHGIAAPAVYSEDEAADTYLQEDLGSESLLQRVQRDRKNDNFPFSLYQDALRQLVIFQTKAAESWQATDLYINRQFDRLAMLSDMQYFHYYFFRPAEISYDQYRLQEDFEKLASFLEAAPNHYLMYRDFQSRNIMIKEEKPHLIDFQGAMLGPLQYDLASLLFQAKAQISHQDRADLLDFYLDELEKQMEVNRADFKRLYYGIVLLRTMQVLGAYGYRGLFERKKHFLQSIPFALENLEWLLTQDLPVDQFPYLRDCLTSLVAQKERWYITKPTKNMSSLTVQIQSFSFKKGWPEAHPEHGGGFVFDCRALHNPGRYEPYKSLTGNEASVQQFLEEKSRAKDFLDDIYRTIDPSVEKYIERGFDHLSINFGCTGGQHRSVYCAIKTAAHLQEKYDVQVTIFHREQPQLN